MTTLTTLIHHSAGNPIQSNKVKERKKMHTNKRGRSKTITFFQVSILYIESPKDSTKKLLERINTVSCKIQNQYAKIHCLLVY